MLTTPRGSDFYFDIAAVAAADTQTFNAKLDMKKIIATALCAAAFSACYALENATIRIYKFGGGSFEKVVKLEPQSDGAMRVRIPKAEIKREYRLIDILADDAVAQKGEKGFFVLGDSSYGEFTRDSGEYSPHRCQMPIFGMQTPNAVFLGVVKGLKFE